MSAAALERDALLPSGDSRIGLGAALALLAHAGLIGALALGLNWRLPTQDAVVSAELWSAVPQAAAPTPAVEPPPAPAPTPAPTPPRPAPERRAEPPPPSPADSAAARATAQAAERDAEIALEKKAQQKKAQQALALREAERRLDEERQRQAQAEALRLKQKLDDKRVADDKAALRKKEQQAKDDKAREDKRQKDAAEQRAAAEKALEDKAQEVVVAKQRQENLKRMLGQAGAAASGTGGATATGTAAKDAAPSAGYAGKIRKAIKDSIIQANKVPGNPVAEVEVRCAPDGSVVGRRIVKPSGNAAWDETVLRAIDRLGSLPRDIDGRIPSTMLLVLSQD